MFVLLYILVVLTTAKRFSRFVLCLFIGPFCLLGTERVVSSLFSIGVATASIDPVLVSDVVFNTVEHTGSTPGFCGICI